jgi:hypothetical protein
LIIRKIYLHSFGKFEEKEIVFDPRLNIIFGLNEAGKSTLQKFIEVMVDSINIIALNRNVDDPEVLLYRPWKHKDRFCGEIYFEHDGVEYKIIRDFLDTKDGIRMFRIDNGEESLVNKVENLNLTTLNIRNITHISGKELVQDIKSRIINKAITNDEDIVFVNLISKLSDKIKSIKNREEYKKYKLYLDNYNSINNDSLFDNFDYAAYKEKYLEREQVKKEKKEIENKIIEIDDQISKYEVSRKALDYYEVVNINKNIERNNAKIEELSIFKGIKSNEYGKYIDAKNDVKERKDKKFTIDNEISRLSSELGIIADDDSDTFLNKISDEKYYKQFLDEVNQYSRFTKERVELTSEISKVKSRLDALLKTIKGIEYSAEMERDYQKYLNERHQIAINSSNYNNINEIDKHTLEVDNLKSKRKKRVINFVLFVIISSLIFVASYFIEPISLYLKIFGLVNGVVAAFFMFLVLQINYQIEKLKHIRIFLQKSNNSYNHELEISKNELELILKKYKCNTEIEFEVFYRNAKNTSAGISICHRDEKLFHARLEDIEDKVIKLKRQIEIRLNQCNMQLSFTIDDPDMIITHLHAYQDSAKRYEVVCNQIEDYKRISDELSQELNYCKNFLDHDNNNVFHKYSYDEILEFKNNLDELLEDNKQLQRKKISILRGDSEDILIEKYSKMSINQEELEQSKRVSEQFENMLILRQDYVNMIHSFCERIGNIDQHLFAINRQLIDYRNKRNMGIVYKNEFDRIEAQVEMINKTIIVLKYTSEKIKNDIYPKIMSAISQNIEKITNKYVSLEIDDHMNIILKDKQGKECLMDSVSLGTIDQVYFAIRIGLMRAFRKEGEIAIILDDAFVQYDVDRFKQVMDVVTNLNEQVILLTCYAREKEYAKQYLQEANYFEI